MARALPKPMPALAALVAGADVLTRPSGDGVDVSLDPVREAYSETSVSSQSYFAGAGGGAAHSAGSTAGSTRSLDTRCRLRKSKA